MNDRPEITELNTLAASLGASILVAFNQVDENKLYQLKSGQCSGITNFWLCSHLFQNITDINELKRTEEKIIEEIKERYSDVLLMQKAFADPNHVPKENLSDLGVTTFIERDQEARFQLTMPSIQAIRSKTQAHDLTQKAKAFILGIKTSTDKEKFISFQYNWTDDAIIKDEKYRDDIDNRYQHGHRVGIIKNPCLGYEILFFDSNKGIYAFQKKEAFFLWLETYFQLKLKLNGQPVAYSRSIAIAAPRKALAVVKNTETSNSNLFTDQILNPLEQHLDTAKKHLGTAFGLFKKLTANEVKNDTSFQQQKNNK